MDLVLINDCGGEIARVRVPESKLPAEMLAELLASSEWTLDIGDTIKVEDTWTEE